MLHENVGEMQSQMCKNSIVFFFSKSCTTVHIVNNQISNCATSYSSRLFY